MGKVEEVLGKHLIGEIPDRDCNLVLIERTPYNYHVHFRNLKIELNEDEVRQWKEALNIASGKVDLGDYPGDPC
jgi:hypothetical protein